MLSPLTLILSIVIFALVHAQSLYPAALPAAVRSPYLNAYVSTAGNRLPQQRVQHWNLQRSMGWSGFIRIDGQSFQLWGFFDDIPNLVSREVTPTRSVFNMIVDSMDVKVTFLSPIEPDNLVLQSFPFSYVYVEASSNDGQPHHIQFYSYVTCEWMSGSDTSEAIWNTTTTDSTTFHECTRHHPESAVEINDMVEDGVVYYASSMTGSVDYSYQVGWDTNVTADFEARGGLFNSSDTAFRAILDSDHYLAFAHAVNLDYISNTSVPVVWGIGLVRDPAILMTSTSGNQTRHSYFFTEYDTIDDAIDFFMGDFSNAQQRAIDLDERVLADARAISDDYADLISLSARQSLAVDITVSRSRDGGFNTSDIMTFMRDIGNSRRSNPVEVIYAAFPIYLYFNPSWAGSLLSPLLSYQSSPMYSRDYASPDLGPAYPYIVGNSDPGISRAIEDSGDMLIMGWAHARFSGDISMLQEYYSTYKSFTEHLISNDVVTPNGFEDADGLSTTNMTNLALKGIIGVKAMSEIASAVGNGRDAKSYSSQADEFIQQWKSLALPQGRLVSTYNNRSSWALIYNMFADKLLGTGLIDDSIYTAQDTFYAVQAGLAQPFGIQYDRSVDDEVKSHWTLFAAAAASDTEVRDALISMVHTKAASNGSVGVFPSTYSADDGSSISGVASPAQGAMFAILSLNLEVKSVSATDSDPNDPPSPRNITGGIVGGVVGGLAGIALIVAGIVLWRRRQRRKNDGYTAGSQESGCFGRKERSEPPEVLGEEYDAHPYDPYGDQTSTMSAGHPFSGARRATSFDSSVGRPVASPNSVAQVPALSPPPQSGKAGMLHMTNPSYQHEYRGGGSVYARSSLNGSNSDGRASHLISEVEQLRQEMDEIRARIQNGYESPPQYR